MRIIIYKEMLQVNRINFKISYMITSTDPTLKPPESSLKKITGNNLFDHIFGRKKYFKIYLCHLLPDNNEKKLASNPKKNSTKITNQKKKQEKFKNLRKYFEDILLRK